MIPSDRRTSIDVEGTLGLAAPEEGLDRKAAALKRPHGAPRLLEHVETDLARPERHVWMEHGVLGREADRGRHGGVRLGDGDDHLEKRICAGELVDSGVQDEPAKAVPAGPRIAPRQRKRLSSDTGASARSVAGVGVKAESSSRSRRGGRAIDGANGLARSFAC